MNEINAVYFITDDESSDFDKLKVKIGFSKNIQKRIRQLQTGSPSLLTLMGYIETNDHKKLEKKLHCKYRDVKSHGEWFNLNSNDVLEELKLHSTNSFISTNNNPFEIISKDKDGIPEFLGAWQWDNVDYQDFCPHCGWGGGWSYNSAIGVEGCLHCGVNEWNDICD